MDEDKWQNRFTNLWLAGEQCEELVHSIEPITKPSVNMDADEAREVSVEKTQTEVSLNREEWLEKFAHLWLTEKRVRLPEQHEKNLDGTNAVDIPDLLTELDRGKAVLGQSRINPVDKNMATSAAAPGPDDLIVFDIDPKIAIKLLTASKGVGS